MEGTFRHGLHDFGGTVSFIHSFFYEIHPRVPNIHVSLNGRPVSVENSKACKQQQPINSK
jgi:hypothetical protein